MIRQGVRSVIESEPGWELCGEADNGRSAIELTRNLAPDIAVLDITMPELNGFDAIRILKAESPKTKVLIFTMHDSESLANDVLQAGADGYLLKSDAAGRLAEAIQALASGNHFLTSKLGFQAEKQQARPGVAPQPTGQVRSRLTPREREIVQLLAEGRSNKQVADALGISPSTVKTHRKNILSKLNVRSTAGLVLYAIRNNLIQA
jgi:DNA-binding NarL/FixJ family response regulator